RQLLSIRDSMQLQIDEWHRQHIGQTHDPLAYRSMLESIGYLVTPGAPFTIQTDGVDAEIASIAGPQLVVPVTNARYALNAANARWGSLYDALYGTDALPQDTAATRQEDTGAAQGGGLNKVRAARVVARAREILDQAVP